HVVWFVGAQGHAAANRREALRRSPHRARRSYAGAAHRRYRRRAVQYGTRAHRAVRESRNHQMGRGGEARRNKSRIAPSKSLNDTLTDRHRRERMMKSPAFLLITLAAGVFSATPAEAQTYPNKPVRIITANSPGGTSDIFVRALGDELAQAS